MKQISNNKSMTGALFISLILFISTSMLCAESPDNAALLYYQAFLLYQKPDAKIDKMYNDFHRGKIKANEKIEAYIEQNRQVIDLVVTAADTPNCDWGYDYSKGMELVMPSLAQFRKVVYLILAKARLLAEKGDYKLALDRCLTTKKIAQHAVDKPLISYLVALAIIENANNCIRDILADMPADLKALEWFKNHLFEIESKFPLFKTCIEGETEMLAVQLTKEKRGEILLSLHKIIIPGQTEEYIAERLRTADEEFLNKNIDYWNKYISNVQSSLELELPYAQMYAKLKKLEEAAEKDAVKNPDATLTANFAPGFSKVYSTFTSKKTFSNAIKTAVEIFIIKAKTGKLPDMLPAGLPKDLHSDENFEYKKSADGFTLRCRGKNLANHEKIYGYEFNVRD